MGRDGWRGGNGLHFAFDVVTMISGGEVAVMNMMNVSQFKCSFSVLAAPRHPEMFMMNMQVYDVHPCPVASGGGDARSTAPAEVSHPISVVWCAVFNTKGMRSV